MSNYAEQTGTEWDRLMRDETAAEQKAEQVVALAATRPHRYQPSELLPGFCGRCHRAERVH